MSDWKKRYEDWAEESATEFLFKSAFFCGAIAALLKVNASNAEFNELYEWRFGKHESANNNTADESNGNPSGTGVSEGDPGSASLDGPGQEVSPR